MSSRKGGAPNMGYANTYNMDTRKLEKPVVLERSERGREMQSSQLTRDISTNDADDRRSKGSVFHEGYVDGKLYLVPDSNLEAMKDIINLKMRRQESSKYMNVDPQKEAESLQRYEQKKEELLKKLEMLDFEPTWEEEEEEEEEEEKEEEEEVEEEEQEVEEEELLEVEEESEEDVEEEVKEEADEEEEVEDTVDDLGEESEEEVDTIFPGQYYNPKVKRFLISGHFRTNRKPIYIIQQYTGPSVFSTKDPQFYSHKSEKDTDIFISGEFYKETILEENKNQEPKRLKTKPRRIGIDNSSRIYEDEFSDTFVGEDVDVTLSGSFIKHTRSTLYTPLVTISLKKGTSNTANDRLGNGRKSAASVYVSRPVVENIFEKEKNKQQITVPRRRTQDVPKKIHQKPHKKSLSKFSANERKKAEYNFPCNNSKSVITLFLAQPHGASPFNKRSRRDEKLASIKARVRGSHMDVPEDLGSSKMNSSGKGKNHKYYKNGKGEKTVEKGSKKKGSKKKSTELTVEDTDECEKGLGAPIGLERKMYMRRERRKDKKKQETRPTVATKLLDRLFKI